MTIVRKPAPAAGVAHGSVPVVNCHACVCKVVCQMQWADHIQRTQFSKDVLPARLYDQIMLHATARLCRLQWRRAMSWVKTQCGRGTPGGHCC